MKQILLLILASFLVNFMSYSQRFKENSIGVVYLTDETEDEYEIEIVFPFKTLIDYSIESPILEVPEIKAKFDTDLPIVLFDSKGELLSVDKVNTVEIVFWCENDGGIQYRPSLKLKLKKERFCRKIEANYDLQEIACFALINQKKDVPFAQVSRRSSNEDIRMKGDLNSDGTLEAVIWVVPDDACNCSGLPENNLIIFLSFNEQDYWMRCCGP